MRLKAILLAGSLLLLSSVNAYCQVLSGSVKDSNEHVVPVAIAYLNPINGGIQTYQKVDAKGNFSLSFTSGMRYVFTLKSLGYLIYRDTIELSDSRNIGIIRLRPIADTATKTLNEVKVFAQRPITQHLSDREVIEVQNSYLGKLPNTVDMLKEIPEITLDGTVVSVLGKNNVAIFINGHQSNVSLASIPIQNIARIEVITNPSAKYDGNMEAIINVILKKGIDDGFQGNFFTNYEQRRGNLYSFGGGLSYNKGIFNSSVSAGYYEQTTNGVHTNSNSVFAANVPVHAINTDLNESSYSYLINIDLEMALLFNKNNKLSVNGNWQPSYTPRDRYIEKDVFTNNVSSKADSSTNSNVLWDYHTRYANGGLSYVNTNSIFTIESRFDLFWQDDGTTTYNNFQFNNFSSINDNTPVTVNTNQYRKSIAYVPSVNFAHQFKNSKLEFGAKYYYINSDFFLNFTALNFDTPDQNNTFSSREHIYAEYVNYSGSWSKLNYEFGLRNEYSTLDGAFNGTPTNYSLEKLLPSATLNYAVAKESKLILSYSKKLSRVPFNRETPLFYYTGPFTAFEGNPFLKPQTLQSLQLKYVYKSFYATLYYNNYTNFLGTLPFIDGNTTILKFSNSDRVNYGIVSGIPVSFTPWWTSQNSVKVYRQNSSGQINGLRFNEGNWTGNLNINENLKAKNIGNAVLLFNYTLPYYSGVNRIRTGASLDLNLTRSFVSKRLIVGLYFRDLLNTYSYSYIFRNTEGVNYNSTIRRDSRGISLSLKYNFEKGRSTTSADQSHDDIQSRL